MTTLHTEGIRVLLVDDEEVFVEMTAETLKLKSFKVETAATAKEALSKLDSQFFDVVLLDVRMPGMDGLAVLRRLNSEHPTQQVVMLTGQATVQMAIEAMKLGAFDFLTKPAKLDDLIITIQRAAERGQLLRRNIVLEKELERSKGLNLIVGESEAVKRLFPLMEKAALTDLPVLVTGESGTGKELVARGIHTQSKRSANPLIVVDASTLHENLLASELFGHEKGAFTGAVQKKVGLFEVADRGSIFLDEIGELSAANQTALLRVIEYGTFRPIGSLKEVKTDVRIIAATNKNLESEVAAGMFREDLYYRLKGLIIPVPPLRERRGDIPLLVEHFLTRFRSSVKTPLNISKEVLQVLMSYNWPGNIRELKHVIELAALFAIEEGEIMNYHLPEEITKKKKSCEINSDLQEFPRNAPSVNGETPPATSEGTSLSSLEDFRNNKERTYIKNVMDQFGGNKSRVAKALGISRALLYKKIRILGLH